MQRLKSICRTQALYWPRRHVLFWLVVGSWLSLLAYVLRTPGRNWLLETAAMLPYHIGITYLALYGVLPLALQGSRRQFIHWAIAYLPGSWVLLGLYRGYILIPIQTGSLQWFPPYQAVIALLDWYIGLLIVGVAVGIRLYRFWYRREQANQQLVRENLVVQLQVLRAQIHPHFLFNTLNNLYAFTLTEPRQAADIVLRLSDLMHYMIHDCDRPDVALSEEIRLVENYIALEKLRYGPRLSVTMNVTGETQTLRIAPLLLIPFVENAFKHGAAQQTGQAHIDLSIGRMNDAFVFTLENSKESEVTRNNPPNRRSLGLANVRKRLALLYPDAHDLVIQSEAQRFVVELTIQLQS